MADFRSRDARLYVSKRPETSFNTPYTAGADFLKATPDTPNIAIPQMEKRNDQGRAGSRFAHKQCNTYWLPGAFSWQEDANFELAARLALRGVGGTVTPSTLVASTVYKHTAKMKAGSAGSQLPSSTVISVQEGTGASFLNAGVVVNAFEMSQEGTNPVRVAFEMLGSGKHKAPHAVTSLPATPSFDCLQPSSILAYTDSGGTVDLAAGCRQRSWRIRVSNNHDPNNDRCNGDPKQDAGNYAASSGLSAAAYLQKLNAGDPVVEASITLTLDETSPLAEWIKMAENTALTNITFGAVGPIITGSFTYALKAIIPAGEFSAVQWVDSNGKAAITLTFIAFEDGTSDSAVTIEVINATATNFD